MAIAITHAFVSAKPNGADSTLIQPSNWNAGHVLTMATARLVGRTTGGTGAAEEISVGAGLSLAAGVLATTGLATSGANSNITSLTGLTTPLSVAQGGTGGATQAGARTGLGLGTMSTKSNVAYSDLAALGSAKRLLGSNETATAGAEITMGDGVDILSGALVSTRAPGRSQTVLLGPVDATTGLPSALPTTSGSLSITTQNVTSTTPLHIAARQGSVSRIALSTTNLTFSSLTASQTCFLYVDIAGDGTLTTGHVILAPVYQQGGSASITANQHTYNIGEGVMYVGNGTVASKVWRVFVGEVVTSGSGVTSAIMYAYSGRYWAQAAIGIAFTPTLFNHNLGVTPQRLDARIINLSGDAFYTPGQIAYPLNDVSGNGQLFPHANNSRNQAQAVWTSFLVVSRQTTGVLHAIDRTKWDWQMGADRGWD